ncbi:unnamed protein product [Spirodela intermedia]|uniref:Uncharacterized protein n=1 Tax=Spirodela intermedia TaxID=51605 RepID=A0A7I8KV58_SPIIN|nr:unnamed protein product [Spirodela intermedia]
MMRPFLLLRLFKLSYLNFFLLIQKRQITIFYAFLNRIRMSC